MGFFETLMNLDVELNCLGTKIFTAKEDLVNKVCYPEPKPEKKKQEEESNSEINAVDPVTEDVNVNNSYMELKALMDEAMELCGDTQIIKQLDTGIKQSIEDLRLYIERAKQEKEKAQQEVQANHNAVQPSVNPYLDVLQTQATADKPIVGMDFSALQQGVVYETVQPQPQEQPKVDSVEETAEKMNKQKKNK